MANLTETEGKERGWRKVQHIGGKVSDLACANCGLSTSHEYYNIENTENIKNTTFHIDL